MSSKDNQEERICASCALPITREKPGCACKSCLKVFHLECLHGPTRQMMVCDKCRAAASPGGITGEKTGGPRDSLGLPPQGLSSTTYDIASSSTVAALQQQVDEMRKMMMDMHAAFFGQGRETQQSQPTGPNIFNINPGTSQESIEQSGQANNGTITDDGGERSSVLNKTQATILASIRAHPVSNGELEFRRSSGSLPQFNGDPTTWFVFYSTYKETTAQCGYSASENLRRIKDALVDPARSRVKHFFEMPHRLGDLMRDLEEEYGTSPALLRHVTQVAMTTTTLREDLSNISDFYAVVLKIADALELLDEPMACPGLAELLVRKMSVARGLDWMRFLNKRTATVSLFQEYIGELCRDVMKIQGNGFSEIGTSKPMKANDAPQKTQRSNVRVMVHEEGTDRRESTGKWTQQSTGESNNGPPAKCLLGCKVVHKLPDCSQFKDMTVKERWAVVKRLGRCAYCFGRHYMAKCRVAQSCPHPACDFKHHPMLHRDLGQETKPKGAFVGVARQGPQRTVYAVAPIVVEVGGKCINTFALMDTGSSTTFIHTGLARRLGLQGPRKMMRVAWTDTKQHEIESERINFTIGAGEGQRHAIEAQTMDELMLPRHTFTEEMARQEGFLDISLPRTNGVVPQILLGLDNARHIVALETKVGNSRRMVATKTSLGWVAMGQVEPGDSARCLFIREPEDDLHAIVEQFIEADHFGLLEGEPIRLSDENERAMELMRTRTRFDGKRYETGLLWKDDVVQLPDNRKAAEIRHRSLIRRLRRESEMWARLDVMMKEYQEKGYVKIVSDQEERPLRQWFLPVFVVMNPNKPDKVRLVWDAAAETNGVALNQKLLVGPDLNASLIHVLLKFRCGRVAVSGDIKEMFHQVRVRPEDRAVQRFLWQGVNETQPQILEMQVMTFGAACSPTLAQYVKNTNADRFAEEYPAAAAAIKERHYVDDYLDSRDTAEEVVQIAKQVERIHQRGGFLIHKFLSNDKTVTRALGGCDEDIVEVSTASTLGLTWNTSDDCFSFRWRAEKYKDVIESEQLPTKRQLLRMAMAIFDPLGLIAFITVIGRILLREAWRFVVEWDQRVPEHCREKWNEWVECLRQLNDHPIPRWYGDLGNDVDLHVFVDASEAAIAAVVYAVKKQLDGTTRVAMIMAKCKVAPLRTKSIPRLELDAAVMGVRLLSLVRAANCWAVNEVFLWSDARDVLYWIRCHKRRYTSYVANRVGTILRNTEVEQWRWTPTDQNPADWATKFIDHRGDTSLWRNGPAFLQLDSDQWPDSTEEPETVKEAVRVMTITTDSTDSRIPPVECFSTWERLVRNVACVERLIAICKKTATKGAISVAEMEAAEKRIVVEAQRHLSTRELQKLSCFRDEEMLWRMRGRTATAKYLSYEEKFPIVLPKGHRVTTLLMDFYHRIGQHCLDQRALHEIRKKFVFLHPRKMLNQVIRQCQKCRLQKATPLTPEMAALPLCRLAVSTRAFTYTGTDLFGPINVKIGRRKEKRWGIIFTCLTTRAVYLDVVNSLSAAACMQAMDGLAARRGPPRQIHSDNGTNFVAASKSYRNPQGQRPKWIFNAPHAPHTGGAWERMIGVTKKVLERMGIEEEPTEERLRWMLSRAEWLINSRPLIDAGVSELGQALTPNDLLFGQENNARIQSQPPQLDATDFMAQRDEAIQRFWKWWTDAYLPTLAMRPKWHGKVECLSVGDVVWICDTDYRYGWRKARIVEATLDAEAGQVRRVLVRTAEGNVYLRHVSKVALIVPARQDSIGKGECKIVESSPEPSSS